MTTFRPRAAAALAACSLLLTAACTSGGPATGQPSGQSSPPATIASGVTTVDEAGITRYTPPVQLGETATRGPDGETPTWYDQLKLTAAEAQQIKDKKLRLALVWHTSSPFMSALTKGVRDTCAALGIEVVAETNANLNDAQLANDLETVLALKPDIIVSIAIDATADAALFRKAVDAGVKLVFASVKPDGFVPGEDYVSLVTYDLAGLGTETAKAMGEGLGSKGKVGVIYYDANFYVTNQREKAFQEALPRDYPGIEVVAQVPMADPAKADEVASALILQHPEIQAIFAPWDTAAEGVAAALRNAGRTDVGIYTIDLGNTNALDMAKDGVIKEMTSTLSVEFGTSLAIAGVYGVLGKEAPKMVIVPAFAVNRTNLAEGWERTFGEPLPADIGQALK